MLVLHRLSPSFVILQIFIDLCFLIFIIGFSISRNQDAMVLELITKVLPFLASFFQYWPLNCRYHAVTSLPLSANAALILIVLYGKGHLTRTYLHLPTVTGSYTIFIYIIMLSWYVIAIFTFIAAGYYPFVGATCKGYLIMLTIDALSELAFTLSLVPSFNYYGVTFK